MMRRVIIKSNWWHGPTTGQRYLALLAIFACISVNGLVIGAEWNATQMAEESSCPKDISNVCVLPECLNTASRVLKMIKPEIKPCDNFYKFACGTYLDKNEIPHMQSAINPTSQLRDKIHMQMIDIITEDRPETDPKFLKAPNALYKACMNKTAIETSGKEPIDKVASKLGGWPVIVGDSWDTENSWTWQDTVATCRALGIETNFIIEVEKYKIIDETNQPMIHVSKPHTRLWSGHWQNELLVSDYFNYMVDAAVLFGADRKTAKKDLQESLDFERNLAKILWSNGSKPEYSHVVNHRSIKEVQTDYGYIDWLKYIRALLPKSMTVDENEIINFQNYPYFRDLKQLLNDTSKRAIANYMMWRIYESSMNFLSSKFLARKVQYNKKALGLRDDAKRSHECFYLVTGLEVAISSLYVRQYFDRELKPVALGMIDGIRESFSQMIDNVVWIDGKTRERAKQKLQSITVIFGFPDELLDNDIMKEYYSKLNFDSTEFFESVLNKNLMDTDKMFNMFNPVEQNVWNKYPPPYEYILSNSPVENSITIPLGLWQEPFFDRHRPMYMNYGSIGVLIAKQFELSLHGTSLLYDNDENLVGTWPFETEMKFLKKMNCLSHQYDKYTDEQTGLKVNGFKTMNQNMEDLVSVKQAYLTYEKWVKKNGEERQLPGLNYTPQRMFWISSAQILCDKARKELVVVELEDNTPPEFKSIGVVSNMKEFSRDFQCSIGSPMNPERKCEAW